MKPLCFKIDEELLHELKVHVAARGQSMQEFMNALIRQTLTSTVSDLLSPILLTTALQRSINAAELT